MVLLCEQTQWRIQGGGFPAPFLSLLQAAMCVSTAPYTIFSSLICTLLDKYRPCRSDSCYSTFPGDFKEMERPYPTASIWTKILCFARETYGHQVTPQSIFTHNWCTSGPVKIFLNL